MKHDLHVVMLQLPVPNNPTANIPLAAGYLKSYAYAQGLAASVNLEILPRALTDHAGDALLLKELYARQPDVLAISLYTWNSERSLTIAALLKQALPNLLVIVGGPEVQQDNTWVLEHPAIDLWVLGEGEQTFVEILQRLQEYTGADCRWCTPSPQINSAIIPLQAGNLSGIPGTIHRHGDQCILGPQRQTLQVLDIIPSPYLAGYLELRPGDMALIECSRWCPYACTFCLYGRNMGTKLGGRMFGTERILAEVAWAKQYGAGAIHFVEANLNLLPNFPQLMDGLQQLNHDPQIPLYAELRGEYLKESTVQALVSAGLHTAEVGLQSANREALLRVGRRTDLEKWAAGTHRLYAYGVHVLLDVILGLPGEDRASTLATLDWIREQQLGEYDIFTLQMLPGTGVRQASSELKIRFQAKPPYYVLETDCLSWSELRGLRWELRENAGFDPMAVEGMPLPKHWITEPTMQPVMYFGEPIHTLVLNCAADLNNAQWQQHSRILAKQLTSHVTLHVQHTKLDVLETFAWPLAQANPTIHWDIVLDQPTLTAQQLRDLRTRWPHEIGYLDRIAVFRQLTPEPDWCQVTPRWWITVPWTSDLDPLRFEGAADIVWCFDSSEWPQALERLSSFGAEYGIVTGTISQALIQAAAECDIYLLNVEGVGLSLIEHP